MSEIRLSDALKEEAIRVGVQAETWRQAIRSAGNLLVDNDCVSSTYVNAMVQAVEEIGPYIVVAPGIAIAHARPEDGVHQICLSLVVLAQPVEFGSTVNDPVDIVFAFGGIDKESHLGLLRQLAVILQDEKAVNEIRKAETARAISDLLQHVEG